MSFYPKNNRFTSKADAMSRAKTTHCCTACLHNQNETFKNCPNCHAEGMRVYFRSRVEHIRGVELIMLQKAGGISNLRFLPKYDLVVEGTKICTYEADAEYIENKKLVVEDTKPKGDFIDKTAVFKIALFNALFKKHGIAVTLCRRG